MRVLMIGAGRDVRGGVSSVVNGYYDAGLDKRCELTYLPTMEDGSKWKKLLVAAKARLRFEWLIRKHDILHVHMSADNSFYRKAMFIRRAHQKKKKIIIHMHGSTFDQFYLERCDERQKSGVWHIFAMADCVLALSEAWQYFLAKHVCSHDKIQVLYNAVKLPDPYEKNYTCRNILFLGKLGQRKGTYDLIEILPDICRKYPDVHIYFCGDGEQEQAKALCREKGILEYVTFSGWVRGSEKEKLLRECSIYALPTYHEGMPMSVLEAMSYGLAVVSTYVGGIPHIIHDGENGLLLEAGDREQLKEKLYQVLANETIRETLGAGAVKTIAEQFDVRKTIDKLMNIYEHLME